MNAAKDRNTLRALLARPNAAAPPLPCPPPESVELPFAFLASAVQDHLLECPRCRQVLAASQLASEEPAHAAASAPAFKPLTETGSGDLADSPADVQQAWLELAAVRRQAIAALAEDGGAFALLELPAAAEDDLEFLQQLFNQPHYGAAYHFARKLAQAYGHSPAIRLLHALAALAVELPTAAAAALGVIPAAALGDPRLRTLTLYVRGLIHLAERQLDRACQSLAAAGRIARGAGDEEVLAMAGDLLDEVELIRLATPSLTSAAPTPASMTDDADALRNWLAAFAAAGAAWRQWAVTFAQRAGSVWVPAGLRSARLACSGAAPARLRLAIADLIAPGTGQRPDCTIDADALRVARLPAIYAGHQAFMLICGADEFLRKNPETAREEAGRALAELAARGGLPALDLELLHVEEAAITADGQEAAALLPFPPAIQALAASPDCLAALLFV